MNQIIAGDYKGKKAQIEHHVVTFDVGFMQKLRMCKNDVESYEVINSDSKANAVSAVGRAMIGTFLVGPVGLAAGLSAKKNGTYQIAVQWKNGKRSLIEVDKKLYKIIETSMF